MDIDKDLLIEMKTIMPPALAEAAAAKAAAAMQAAAEKAAEEEAAAAEERPKKKVGIICSFKFCIYFLISILYDLK